jgi:hypothetical protein
MSIRCFLLTIILSVHAAADAAKQLHPTDASASSLSSLTVRRSRKWNIDNEDHDRRSFRGGVVRRQDHSDFSSALAVSSSKQVSSVTSGGQVAVKAALKASADQSSMDKRINEQSISGLLAHSQSISAKISEIQPMVDKCDNPDTVKDIIILDILPPLMKTKTRIQEDLNDQAESVRRTGVVASNYTTSSVLLEGAMTKTEACQAKEAALEKQTQLTCTKVKSDALLEVERACGSRKAAIEEVFVKSSASICQPKAMDEDEFIESLAHMTKTASVMAAEYHDRGKTRGCQESRSHYKKTKDDCSHGKLNLKKQSRQCSMLQKETNLTACKDWEQSKDQSKDCQLKKAGYDRAKALAKRLEADVKQQWKKTKVMLCILYNCSRNTSMETVAEACEAAEYDTSDLDVEYPGDVTCEPERTCEEYMTQVQGMTLPVSTCQICGAYQVPPNSGGTSGSTVDDAMQLLIDLNLDRIQAYDFLQALSLTNYVWNAALAGISPPTGYQSPTPSPGYVRPPGAPTVGSPTAIPQPWDPESPTLSPWVTLSPSEAGIPQPWEPTQSPSQLLYRPPSSTSEPSDSADEDDEVVVLEIGIRGIILSSLSANSALLGAFLKAIEDTVSSSTDPAAVAAISAVIEGLTADSLAEVKARSVSEETPSGSSLAKLDASEEDSELRQESIVVLVRLELNAGYSATDVTGSLSSSLSESILAAIQAVPGIDAVIDPPLQIEYVFAKVEDSTAAPAPNPAPNPAPVSPPPTPARPPPSPAIPTCYKERSLVEDQGEQVSYRTGYTAELSPFDSIEQCKAACSGNAECNSISVCDAGPQGCWMMKKTVDADMPRSNGTKVVGRGCRTIYKVPCDTCASSDQCERGHCGSDGYCKSTCDKYFLDGTSTGSQCPYGFRLKANAQDITGADINTCCDRECSTSTPCPNGFACEQGMCKVICRLPDAVSYTGGRSCPSYGCLLLDVPFDTLAEAWDRCYYVAECGLVMKKAGKFYLRRLSDPVDASDTVSQIYTYSCAPNRLCYKKRSIVKETGTTLGSLVGPYVSEAQCEAMCRQTGGCKSFTMCGADPKGCWLKNSVVNVETEMGSQQHGRSCNTFYERPCNELSILHKILSNDGVSLCFTEDGIGFVDAIREHIQGHPDRDVYVGQYTSEDWITWSANHGAPVGEELVKTCSNTCPLECYDPNCIAGQSTNGGVDLEAGTCRESCSPRQLGKRFCGNGPAYVGEGSVDCSACQYSSMIEMNHSLQQSLLFKKDLRRKAAAHLKATRIPEEIEYGSGEAARDANLLQQGQGAQGNAAEVACLSGSLDLHEMAEDCQNNTHAARTQAGCEYMCRHTPGCSHFDFTNDTNEIGCRCGAATFMSKPLLSPNPHNRTYCVMRGNNLEAFVPDTLEASASLALAGKSGTSMSSCTEGHCVVTDDLMQGSCDGETIELCMAACLSQPGCVAIEFNNASSKTPHGSSCRCTSKVESQKCSSVTAAKTTKYCLTPSAAESSSSLVSVKNATAHVHHQELLQQDEKVMDSSDDQSSTQQLDNIGAPATKATTTTQPLKSEHEHCLADLRVHRTVISSLQKSLDEERRKSGSSDSEHNQQDDIFAAESSDDPEQET